jgi:hypothetical protein
MFSIDFLNGVTLKTKEGVDRNWQSSSTKHGSSCAASLPGAGVSRE